ncbi:MAG TPA: glycerate kinase, partial [Puia sp.]|nr:glycerate kinase [Puia sp.]
MYILIAPNAFKHSLDAAVAAEAIRVGLEQSRLSGTFECFPIGDGGDGTGRLIVEKLQGRSIPCPVHDPLGRMIEASF